MSETPVLISFAPMIDAATWRLLLRAYGIAYTEAPHAFLWASILTLFKVGSLQVPALSGGGFKMVDPQAAIDRWDAGQPPGRALIPSDPMMRGVALDDWDRFHGTLATCTAQLAYYHLLPHRDIMLEPFTRGIPRNEMALARIAYPLQRGLLSLLLQLNAKNAADALATIRTIFDQTDLRLRDGRTWLQGERLTLGDVALAAAAAPVTLPLDNLSPIPPLDRMPSAYAAIVQEMRQHPTARLVQMVHTRLRPA